VNFIGRKMCPLKEDKGEEFGVVQGATLTLPSLLIGFAFSMAVSRYDQQKHYEKAAANEIGTEYVRVKAWFAFARKI
jgi:uncharacterized membrane protein YcfT